MAITKPLVTTTVTVLHQEDPVVFADAVGQDGKVTRDGTNARYQILHGNTVAGNVVADGGTVYTEIPFHAVVIATVEKVTSDPIEEPEDAFCVSESTPTGDINLLDGTYTFEDQDSIGVYQTRTSACYNPADVTVTVDGTTVVLPKFSTGVESVEAYGEYAQDAKPLFTTYPAAVSFDNEHKTITVCVETAGDHTITVIVPSGSKIQCPNK